MNQLIKKILFIAMTMYSSSISAQFVGYGYDPAGNRIKREILIPVNENRPTQAPKKAVSTEMLSDRIIKIYPNPTKGMLKVEIGNYDASDVGVIKIFDSNGVEKLNANILESAISFDISGYSPGLYFMHIRINEDETTWKIIKQ